MATKKSPLKLLFFSPYFYPYISGLTQYPYRLFTESQLPLEVTCLTFKHEQKLVTNEVILSGAKNLTSELSEKNNTEFTLSKTKELDPSVVSLPQDDTSLTILRMPFWFRLSKGFISPQSFAFFNTEIKKTDVVILNLPSIEGLFLAFYAKLQKKPIVSLLHCEVLLPFSPLNLIINTILDGGVFLQLLLSNTIIVYTKDYYEKKWKYNLFKHKMQVILPPVHLAKPNANYSTYLNKIKKGYNKTIGFCGRIAAEKGIEVLIDSVSQVKNSLLLFAGPTKKDVVGEENYFTEIEKVLVKKNIPHIFLGTLSGGDLSSFYTSIDVLALPSLNKTEAFGMVQAEAMLAGTPVIASNLPGVRVPIQLTQMGILTKPGSKEEVAKALKRVLHNKSKYSNPHLIHNAKELFDSQKTYASIYSVIKSALGIRHFE